MIIKMTLLVTKLTLLYFICWRMLYMLHKQVLTDAVSLRFDSLLKERQGGDGKAKRR